MLIINNIIAIINHSFRLLVHSPYPHFHTWSATILGGSKLLFPQTEAEQRMIFAVWYTSAPCTMYVCSLATSLFLRLPYTLLSTLTSQNSRELFGQEQHHAEVPRGR